ncbi:hypothetical protein BKA70DRAFT_1540306 [Coprinopsis sp. MPI-PUGE-AT-0042]|nr:hypothetical protein BKA70DRAFT_1540306 [Coprinopsis sp. MPI-PUGE-AT-0042]
MGNSCSGRTVKEVTDDLEVDLLTSAKSLLSKEFGQTLASSAGLQDAVDALAKAKFTKDLGYDWNSNADLINPPDMDKVDKRRLSADDYCIIPDDKNIATAVADYIDKGLNDVHLDDWMKANATADLAAAINQYISYPVDNEWHLGTKTLRYDAVVDKNQGNSQDSGQDSYKLALSLVYTNATKTESAVEVSLHVFYFVGVYYTVESPKAATFAELRQDAWSSAQQLTQLTDPHISNDTSLKDAFYKWGTSDSGPFKNDFQRAWGTHAPDFATDEQEPVDTANSALAFFQTNALTDEYLDSYVTTKVLSGISLPTQNMTDWIKGILVQQYKSITSQPNTSGWSITKLDQSYGLGNASVRPIRLNGELIYWAKTKDITVANQSVTVYVYYIYFLGTIYDLEPDPIYTDLSKTLIASVPGHGAATGTVNANAVKKAVEDWNRSNFATAYALQFPMTQHDPSDTKANWWWGFFEFDHFDPTQDDIMTEVTDRLFARDSATNAQIHHDLQPKVYDWVVKMFSDLAGTKTLKDPNAWYSFTKENSFEYVPHANRPDEKWVLAARTAWAYCNGTITESSRGNQTLNHFCLSVLIYITAAAEGDDSSDV